jgi:hypothetical protein
MTSKEPIRLDSSTDLLESAPKRPYSENTNHSIPSLNQQALDEVLFDWTHSDVVRVSEPTWDAVIASKLTKEKAKVPIHPLSAFEWLNQPNDVESNQ